MNGIGLTNAPNVPAYRDVAVMPCEGAVAGDMVQGRAGAYTSQGAIIEATLLKRQYAPVIFSLNAELLQASDPDAKTQYITTPAAAQLCRETLTGTHVFGGYFFNHFGHFLLETLACA